MIRVKVFVGLVVFTFFIFSCAHKSSGDAGQNTANSKDSNRIKEPQVPKNMLTGTEESKENNNNETGQKLSSKENQHLSKHTSQKSSIYKVYFPECKGYKNASSKDEMDKKLSADELHKLGQKSIREKKPAFAIAYLLEARKKEPDNAYITGDLSTAFLQCGLIEKAVEMAVKAHLAKPDDVDLAANLAQVYQIGGYVEKSIKAYEKAIQIAPDDAAIYNNLAVVYTSIRNLDKAEEFSRQAVKLMPQNSSLLVNLGSILYKKNQPVDALIILQRAVKLDPKNVSAHNQLGLVYHSKGDDSSAGNCFREALKISPDNKAARENLNAIKDGFDFKGPWNKQKE